MSKAETLADALSEVLRESGLPADRREARAVVEKDWRKKGSPQGDKVATLVLHCYDALMSPVLVEDQLRGCLLALVNLVHPNTTPTSLRVQRDKVERNLEQAAAAEDAKVMRSCTTALRALDALLA